MSGFQVKTDLVNLGALAGVQASNALAPLVMFPFLLHALGSEAYAEVVFAEALSLLVLTVVAFSFEVTSVPELVRLREKNDQEAISRLFSTVLCVRLILFAVSAIVAIGLYTLVLGGSWTMVSLWMLVPLAYVFQSLWFYLGSEHNAPVGIVTLVSRVSCVMLVFILVKDEHDGNLVPAVMGTTYLVGGVAAFAYAVHRYRLRLRAIPLRQLGRDLIDGKEIFAGNIAVSLQRDVNVLILGVAGVPAGSLAAYSVAEKLSKSLQAVSRPLNQLFFPKVVRAIRDDTAPTRSVARKIARRTVPQVALMALILVALTGCYFAVQAFTTILVTYPNIDQITSMLAIMAPTVVFGIVSFMFGLVGLNYLGHRKTFFAIILVTGTTSAAVCFTLSHWIGAYAAALCYAGAEIASALLVVYQYNRSSAQKTMPSQAAK